MEILNYSTLVTAAWRFLHMPNPQIAKKVINECLQVKEDEQVLIQTWDHTLDISNALALEVYQAGAIPLVELNTDELFLNFMTKVPERHYGRTPRAMLSLLDQVDASVSLFGPRDPKILRKAPGERFAKAFDSQKPILEKYRERKIRTANLPVGYITPERAENYGFDLAKWRRNFDQALDVDLKKMSELGRKLASRLQNAGKVMVTHSNGTQLRFTIADRPVHVRDGIIDEQDVSKGNFTESLPSGTVTVAPVESSVEGTVMFDQPAALMGRMVKGLRLNFQNGRLESFDAKENLDAFGDLYRGATGDKDRMGFFSIGINPKAGFMGITSDELVLGAVTIDVGYNKDIGGSNDTSIQYGQTLTGATVEADRKPLVQQGKLQI